MTAVLHQPIVAAFFDDAPLLQNDNPVGRTVKIDGPPELALPAELVDLERHGSV